MYSFFTLQVIASLATPLAANIPFADYILAPKSRTVNPASIHQVNRTVYNTPSLVGSVHGSAICNGISSVTFGHAKNIAGIVSVTVGHASSPNAFIGLIYTESSLWINVQASDATADVGLDEVCGYRLGEVLEHTRLIEFMKEELSDI
jgi:hypothetical protein